MPISPAARRLNRADQALRACALEYARFGRLPANPETKLAFYKALHALRRAAMRYVEATAGAQS